jgi:transitional endoplasmic reticulum ATPase
MRIIATFTRAVARTHTATSAHEDAISPGVLLEGRIDRAFRVQPPDVAARVEIVRCLLRDSRAAVDDSEALALYLGGRAHGFTPADILHVLREAAFAVARRCGSDVHGGSARLTVDDVAAAAAEARPSALVASAFASGTPRRVEWGDLVGVEGPAAEVRRAVERPLSARCSLGVPLAAGVLLHGPSGTGKTMMLCAVGASEHARAAGGDRRARSWASWLRRGRT